MKMTTQPNNSVFAGLKVVEIASFIAAPAAATMLSDFGADVIKVEPPGLGDPQRLLSSVPPSPAAPGNYSWHLANRNKRGMSVNLKSEGGTEILKRLVQWADVVITNFPHGTRESLHLGYEEVSSWNPRVIYADITGYGDAGPDAALPGFDLTAFWSRSGLLGATRDAGAPPTAPVWGSGDYTTATAIYAAITTALYHRERTGRGANVGTSLLATGVWATGTLVSAALAGAKPYELHDRNRPVNALTNAYECADGRWLMLAGKQSAWPTIAAALGRSDLLDDPRFSDKTAIAQHAAELAVVLEAEFRSQPLAHWQPDLDKARVPYGVVQTPEEAAEDPQLRASGIVVPIEGATDVEYTVNNPISLRGLDRVPSRRAPEHGEHNDEVLAELGFSVDDIAGLREQNAIPSAPEQETAK
jgi:crotonobetainyl-CoA:carnitine CoA-transferase CaiB-like acyl-CoA transferase